MRVNIFIRQSINVNKRPITLIRRYTVGLQAYALGQKTPCGISVSACLQSSAWMQIMQCRQAYSVA